MPINRTSHPQGRGMEMEMEIEIEIRERIEKRERERERRVTELLLAVHPPSQEPTLARLFFLVLLIIISPRGNPPHHTLE